MKRQTLSVIVEGGKASPAPPLGPSLAQAGLKIPLVIAQINEKTKTFAGMKVPVKISFDSVAKTFEVEVGMPSTSELLKKEAGITIGSATTGATSAGNVKFEQVIKIAKLKSESMGAKKLKIAAKQIAGSCASIGLTIDGKSAREVQKEIDEGKYDSHFKD